MLRLLTNRRLLRVWSALVAPMLLLALWLPGCHQGGWRVDTPFYAAVSKLILETGTFDAWWYPMAGTVPYFNKPPVPFWIHAAFYKLLGTELWSVRLVTLLGAMAAVEITRRAAKEMGGRRVGLLAGVVLATTLEFFRYTRAFSLDIWVVLFLVLAAWSALAAVKRERAWLFAVGGVPLGLCLLSKPIFPLLFPLVFAGWLVWIGRWRWIGWAAAMAAVGVLVAAPWHWSMVERWGRPFVDQYFLQQSLERALGDEDAKPWWYLPWEFLRSYWPWMLALVPAAWTLARRRSLSGDRRLDRFAVLWVVVFVGALLTFGQVMFRYAVPVYPALAVVCSAWLACHSPRVLRRAVGRAAVLAPIPALAVSVALALSPIRFSRPPSPEFDRLDKALADLGNPKVWCVRDAVRSCAVMYLRGGTWPPGVKQHPDLPGGYPKAGDVVLYAYDTREASATPRPGDQVLGKFSALNAVRLTRDWDAPDESTSSP